MRPLRKLAACKVEERYFFTYIGNLHGTPKIGEHIQLSVNKVIMHCTIIEIEPVYMAQYREQNVHLYWVTLDGLNREYWKEALGSAPHQWIRSEYISVTES